MRWTSPASPTSSPPAAPDTRVIHCVFPRFPLGSVQATTPQGCSFVPTQEHPMRSLLACIFCFILAAPTFAAPTDTHFTYQGRLKKSGLPITGTADLTFTLFDSASGGAQIGATQSLLSTTLADGLLTVDLDFGASSFNGDGRWLQIAVR